MEDGGSYISSSSLSVCATEFVRRARVKLVLLLGHVSVLQAGSAYLAKA